MLNQLATKKKFKADSFDFFKIKKKAKSNKKRLGILIQFIAITQLIFFTAATNRFYMYIDSKASQVEQSYLLYKSYEEDLSKRDYKAASYKMHSLLNHNNVMANILALSLVNKLAIGVNENSHPQSFIDEQVELAKKYSHHGVESEKTRLNNIELCIRFDLICNIAEPWLKSFIMPPQISNVINKRVYQLYNIDEYKQYYKLLNESKTNILSPYDRFMGNK